MGVSKRPAPVRRRTRPTLRNDFIPRRKMQVDVVRIVAEGRARAVSHPGRTLCATCTLSFTANHLIDDLVQQLAMELNLSRSAAIRQAIMHYHAEIMS